VHSLLVLVLIIAAEWALISVILGVYNCKSVCTIRCSS